MILLVYLLCLHILNVIFLKNGEYQLPVFIAISFREPPTLLGHHHLQSVCLHCFQKGSKCVSYRYRRNRVTANTRMQVYFAYLFVPVPFLFFNVRFFRFLFLCSLFLSVVFLEPVMSCFVSFLVFLTDNVETYHKCGRDNRRAHNFCRFV